jgi:hypothetical protein
LIPEAMLCWTFVGRPRVKRRIRLKVALRQDWPRNDNSGPFARRRERPLACVEQS